MDLRSSCETVKVTSPVGSGVDDVEDSFLGVPSSSFLQAVGTTASSFPSSSAYDANVISQRSSDSGNFHRASQPTTSVLGIPESDRLFIKNRYGPKSRFPSQVASRPVPGPSGGATRVASRSRANVAQRGSNVAQSGANVARQRRVMARLNPTGSRVKETKLPSFIVVDTPYSKSGYPMDRSSDDPRRISARDSEHGDAMESSSIVVPRRVYTSDASSGENQENQNNVSAENGRFRTKGVAAKDEEEEWEDEAMDTSGPMSLMKLHHQWDWQQQKPQQRQRGMGSTSGLKGRHAGECNKNFNAEAACNCHTGDRDQGTKLNADVTTDIIPERRRRGQSEGAKILSENDCDGEGAWNWHVDATWGCNKYPEVYYCDENCPSLLEYLLCPAEDCDEEDEEVEWTKSAQEDYPDLEAVITLRQGESADCEVRNMNVVKKGRDDFTVSWLHPKGSHPLYVVVVYPPPDKTSRKPRGADCTTCADEEECICGTLPLFRRHIDGGETNCDIPAEILESGKSFIVEVATLTKARDESFGTSLVIIDVYERNK